MNKESIQTSTAQIEFLKLNRLLRVNEVGQNYFIFHQVEDTGYIVQNQERDVIHGNGWLLFDYDDTLAAYTFVKQERLSLLEKYIQKLELHLTNEQIQQILKITDTFSRWKEREGEGVIYHPNAHMVMLQWVINSILESTNKNGITQLLEEIRAKLDRTLALGELQSQIPFYIRDGDKKLIIRGRKSTWSTELEDIFLRTILNPPHFQDLIAAVEENRNETVSQLPNIGIFTFGDPYGQLLKILGFLKKNPDFPVAQIWLTRKDKGSFLKDATKSDSSSTGGILQINHEQPSPITIIDDNPNDLASIEAAREILYGDHSGLFEIIRSRRKGTKHYSDENRTVTPILEIDFDEEPYALTRIISSLLLINQSVPRAEFVNDQAITATQTSQT